MTTVLVELTVDGFDRFMEEFRGPDAELRAAGGSTGATVYRDLDAPDRVVIVFGWDSRETFEAFRREAEARAGSAPPGERPDARIRVLERAEELPA
jgi:heme-degrading monooxygenase HmoA